MKIKFFLFFIVPFFCFSFVSKKNSLQEPQLVGKPRLFTNNFKTEIPENLVVNCRKIPEMGVEIYLNDEMKKQDLLQVELHRFGDDEDVMFAYKKFLPNTKEFQKKYSKKETVRLKFLTIEDGYSTSDFTPDINFFKDNYYLNEIVCSFKDKVHCSFYLVIKSYTKTGEKNKFGDDLYDKGVESSARSTIFKNWEDKTK